MTKLLFQWLEYDQALPHPFLGTSPITSLLWEKEQQILWKKNILVEQIKQIWETLFLKPESKMTFVKYYVNFIPFYNVGSPKGEHLCKNHLCSIYQSSLRIRLVPRVQALYQGWPNHCPGAKKCPLRNFEVPLELFWN